VSTAEQIFGAMSGRVGAAVEALPTAAVDESWCDLTAAELLVAYAEGSVDPLAVVDACLARIDRLDPVVGAVMTVDDARAVAAATQSAARWRAGTPRPLEGIPIVVKDLLDTGGLRTTGGSRVYADRVPDRDAAGVAAVRDAGAIVLAKTATYELGCGSEVGAFGVTRNPWGTAHTTGGSSSGSAAALAARLAPLALGTDTGGSIRIPSAWCGVVGLKPTLGRVPTDGLLALSPTLDTIGPMGRDAVDVSLLLGALVPGVERQRMTRRLDGVRIGVATGWLTDVLADDVGDAFDSALASLRDLGADLTLVDVSEAPHGAPLSWTITMAEASRSNAGVPRDDMTPEFRSRLEIGDRIEHADYVQALRARHVLAGKVCAELAGVDAFVVPTCVSVAPRLDDMDAPVAGVPNSWPDVSARTVALWNVIGLPAVSVPIGFNPIGLPIAMQFVGLPHSDARLLALAEVYQAATDHHRAVPGIVAR
jgi:aspartyl-tRNA(Asn)/glutamyl-tRNA(Gln) amidotransferase subunit A